MDPARTRKLTKKVDKQQQQQQQKPPGSFKQQRPSNPPQGIAAGRPSRAGAPPSKITSLPSFNAAKKGSFPAQTPLPSSYTPARPPPREPRPPPPAKALKPKDASLKLTTLTKPLPSLGAYPNLVRLDLSSVEGGLEGVGAGWIGKEFGSQLTWLSLAGCEGLARTHDWEGFELLTGLVVLNLSNCGLTELPSELASLTSLKAFVATHNSLTSIPPQLLSPMQHLNSLILSHNPLLTSLPSSLSQLPSLAKLSASNCALTASSLPDLSSLPYLRVLSLSNNPHLSSLPPHFHAWGTGPLPATSDKHNRPHNTSAASSLRRGDGLEVVELGSCKLDQWRSLEGLVRRPKGEPLKGLRSLGLRGNGVTTLSGYADKITTLLPSIQILDNARIVERRAKQLAATKEAEDAEQLPSPEPDVQEARSGSPSPPEEVPAGESSSGKRKRKRKSRAAGDADDDDDDDGQAEDGAVMDVDDDEEGAATGARGSGLKKRKRSRKAKGAATMTASTIEAEEKEAAPAPATAPASNNKKATRRKRSPVPESLPTKTKSAAPTQSRTSTAASTEDAAALPPPTKPETSVLKVIEVKKKGAKGGKSAGVDLEALFSGEKKKETAAAVAEEGVVEGRGGGFGWDVGGWD